MPPRMLPSGYEEFSTLEQWGLKEYQPEESKSDL